MMTTLLDAVADRIGRVLQRFGVKRALMAALGGLMVVWVVAALLTVGGALWLIFGRLQ